VNQRTDIIPTNEALQAASQAAEGQDTAARSTRGGVTWRAIFLGLFLTPVTIYWITLTEVRWYTLDGTSLPLFIQPVFFLFLLCLLNIGVKAWRGRAWLEQGELLVVYIMLGMACVFAGHDMLQNLIGVLGHPQNFASPSNNWEGKFFTYLPEWLFVLDKENVTQFYAGNVDIYKRPELLQPWVLPLFWWGIFVFVQAVLFLSFNVLIRRAWTEHEKLSFPLVQLPLAMTDPSPRTPFWKNKVMWAGFVVAGGITLMNGLNYLYPFIPQLAVKQYNITQGFTTRPWNAVGGTNISLYPFAIGLAYFIPLDLSFSCWFFFLWRKAQQVFGAAAGLDAAGNRGWPFFAEQSSGAWIGVILILVWSNRAYVQRVLGEVLGMRRPSVPRREMLHYRLACAGIAVGLLLLWVFFLRMGMTPMVAGLYLGIYLGLSVAITRVRAELGTPHEINFVSPNAILVNTVGTSALGPQNLTAMASCHWFNRGYRCHPMPNQLEAMKMAEGGRINLGRLYLLVIAVSAVCILVTYWANMDVTWAAGATGKAVGFKRWVGAESFDRLNGWIGTSFQIQDTNLGWMAGGLLFTFFLKTMRGMFVWWPFHPMGYALALSFAMDYFWFAFMLSWLVKLVLVRWGGMRTHTQAAPFFLGLILGDYVVGSLWAIYGPAMQMSTYKIFI
jgi:uncharacterized protein DUF6785/uncharacterized protein DUF6784